MSPDNTNKERRSELDAANSGFSGDGNIHGGLSATETSFNVGQVQDALDRELGEVPFAAPSEGSEGTIRRILNDYDIGRKIRQLRLKKKIALVDLGKHTGLSASMLSQLENGKLIPTLPTLARIAMVFDIGVDHFFVDRKEKYRFSVVRAGDRLRFPETADAVQPAYFFECLAFGAQDKNLHPYLAEFSRRAEHEMVDHAHTGTEFIFVLEGQLEIRYRDDNHLLNPGDSAYFDASEQHSYRGVANSTRAVVVTSTA